MIKRLGFKNSGEFEVTCDFCQGVQVPGAHSWDELMEQMRGDGFRNVKLGEVWKHKCPICVTRGA